MKKKKNGEKIKSPTKKNLYPRYITQIENRNETNPIRSKYIEVEIGRERKKIEYYFSFFYRFKKQHQFGISLLKNEKNYFIIRERKKITIKHKHTHIR